MDIEEWKRLARSRLESGAMSKEEWDAVLTALLRSSEDEWIALFDDAIAEQHKRTAAKPQGE